MLSPAVTSDIQKLEEQHKKIDEKLDAQEKKFDKKLDQLLALLALAHPAAAAAAGASETEDGGGD